jgi:hypothetical protein
MVRLVDLESHPMPAQYDELAECFRNVYKDDHGIHARGWSRADMQAYLDRREAVMTANVEAGRDPFEGIGC